MRRFKKLMVTVLVVATVLGTAGAFTSAAGLLDVEGTKYADSVNKLVGINVLTGYPDGTFKPTATVTRAQMAAIMVRGLGHEALAALSKGTTPFSDVPATHWASGYVNVAYNKGIVSGLGDGKYGPDATVTYAQAVTMLVRAVGRAGEVTGAWPVGYIEVAQKHGLTANVSFDANAPATRGDVAIMTKTAVYNVTDPVTKETLAWSAHKVAAAKPDTTAPVVTLGTLPAKTLAEKVTVTGTLDEAAVVTVNGTAATVSGLTFSAEVALTAGANTITVEATDKYSNKGTATAAITRQTINSIVVTPATASVALGTSVQFAAKALDEAGAELEGVTFTWSLTGVGLLNATGLYGATASGAATVKATAGTKDGTATVAAFGTASKIVLSTPTTIVANGASSAVLTATVQDAAGNTVANFNGPVTFVSSNVGSVTVSAGSVAAVNGVASVTLKSAAKGATAASVISATATGVTGATATITPAAQVLTSIGLSASPATIAADNASTTTITATGKDQEGVSIPIASLPAGLNVQVTTGTPDVANFGGGTPATANITFGTGTVVLNAKLLVGSTAITGVVTLPAAQTAKPVTGCTVTTQVIGPPYKLALDAPPTTTAGGLMSFKVRVLDFNGNQITTPLVTGTVTVKAGTVPTNISGTPVAGSDTVNWTQVASGTVTFTATGTLGTTALQSTTTTGTFTPGAATQLTLVPSPGVINANGIATSTLTATVRDALGNKVTEGSYAITFKKTTDNGATAAFTDTVVNSVGGVATVVVTSTAIVAMDTFTVTCTGLNNALVGVQTQVQGVASALGAPAPASGVPAAGANNVVTVAVRDAIPNTVTADNGRTVTLTVYKSPKATFPTPIATYTATTVNGVATFTTNLTGAFGHDLDTASTGLTSPATVVAAIAPVAGAPTNVVLSADLTTLAADGVTSEANVTATLKDAYGNTAASTGIFTLTLTRTNSGANGGFGDLFPATTTMNFAALDTAKTTATTVDSLHPGTAPGTIAITASGTMGTTALTSNTLTVTTLVVGAPTALRIEPLTTKTAGVAQTVLVTVVDGNGNRVTGLVATGITLVTTGAATIDATPVATIKGQSTFTVRDNTAQTVTLTATAPALSTATASSTWVPGAAAHVDQVSASPANIQGNGSQLSVLTFQMSDTNHNKVPTYSGGVTFAITSGADYAELLSTSGTFAAGEATVQLRAKTTTDSRLINVTATPTDTTLAALPWAGCVRVDGVNPTANAPTNPANTSIQPTILAVATDDVGGSGVASVKFQYKNITDGGVWTDFSTVTAVNTNVADTYAAVWGATNLIPTKTYNFRTIVTDVSGRSATSLASAAVVIAAADVTAPTVSTVVLANGGATVNTVEALDTITVTFNEAMRAASFIAGLTPGGFLLTPAITVTFDAGAKTIVFAGANIGAFAITLGAGTMTNTATYGVGKIELDNAGAALKVTLGARTVGALDTVFTAGVGLVYTFTGSASVTDAAGNAYVPAGVAATGTF